MFKIHKIKNLDTLESELNKIVSELEIDNNVLDIKFNKILDSDVVIIDYISTTEIEKLRNKHMKNNMDSTEQLDISITELVDEFLQEHKVDSVILRASDRNHLWFKIKAWLETKKEIKQTSLISRDLSWNMSALITSKIESELRQNIPKMNDELYKWCTDNNVKKITKSLMKGYFEEKDEWCPSSITDILYTKVNLKLSK